MPKKTKDTRYVSIMLSETEKQILDDAVADAKQVDAGMTRNRFIRNWIATLWKART